jgi:hypothetical protein
MVDEFFHKNPPDLPKEIFVRLEEKVDDISHNMTLCMVALSNKLIPFEEVRGSNSKIRSEGKLRDNEDQEKELRKETEKENPSSSAITPSWSLFKMEVKVDIKPYQGDIMH